MRDTPRYPIPPLRAADVLPALQLALEHNAEHGWEAVRRSLGPRHQAGISFGLIIHPGSSFIAPLGQRNTWRSSEAT